MYYAKTSLGTWSISFDLTIDDSDNIPLNGKLNNIVIEVGKNCSLFPQKYLRRKTYNDILLTIGDASQHLFHKQTHNHL